LLTDDLKDLALTGRVQPEIMNWIREKVANSNS